MLYTSSAAKSGRLENGETSGHSPKKGNLQMCQNYRTISLINHPSKVMLKILLNRLKPHAEEIIAEEQVGFCMGRSTTEQISNLRVLMEKYQQHQQDLYHVFTDFEKAFDRVWHVALWTTMHKYNISTNLTTIIKSLYEKATSAVLFNGNTAYWFRTTVGVRQGCLVSPTLFNVFLEKSMADALENNEGTVRIGGRIITNLRFADDRWTGRQGRRTGKPRQNSGNSDSVWHGNQPRKKTQRSCQLKLMASQKTSR